MSLIEEPIVAEDGSKHIRIHPRGKTLLGRLLSNTAHTPFEHPVHGKFQSLEGFWLWNCSGRAESVEDECRQVYGTAACSKLSVRVLRRKRPDFRREICELLRLKIEQNPRLKELFVESSLPFIRYDVTDNDLYPTVVVFEEQAWFLKELNTYRLSLRRKAVAA